MAAKTLLELETDLLRSVSCFLEPQSLGGKFCASARCLIWPLAVLSHSELNSPSARKYAVSCLYQIGEDLNMEQAIAAAKMTREMNKHEDWCVEISSRCDVANEVLLIGCISTTSDTSNIC